MKKRAEAGFSLLELIISLLLSTLVLIGVITMATQAVRNQYGTIKTGEVSALTLAGLDAMNREIENSSYLAIPTSLSPAGNVISACMNYSQILAGNPGINGGTGSLDGGPIKSYYYCVRPDGAGRFDSLLRYPQIGQYGPACPFPAPASCGAGGPFDVIVGKNFSLMDNYGTYFARDDNVGGVDLHFIVGNSTPTTTAAAGTVAMPVPVAYKIDTKLSMAKSYNSGE